MSSATPRQGGALPRSAPFGRRALPRVGISVPVSVEVAGLPGALAARTRDLGVSGVCVSTPSCFVFGGVHHVVLDIPQARLRIAAQGHWQREVSGRDAFLTGISFREPFRAVLDPLWDVVHERTKWLTRWLAQQPELALLAAEDMLELAHVTRLREMRVGESIYRPGAPQAVRDDAIFIVLSGRLILELRAPTGRLIDVTELGPGCVAGGLGLIADQGPSQTCLAASDSTLLEISRDAFENLRATSPGLATRLGAIAMQRESQRMLAALHAAVGRS